MKKIFFSLGFVIVVCFILFTPFKLVFSFEETRTPHGHVVYIPYSEKETSFQMMYTHSIHLSDVVEHYEVMDDFTFKAIAMEYEDVAIGMPGNAEEEQTLTIQDGKYRLTSDDKFFQSFTMHISNISSSQHFIYDQVEYDLKRVLKKGSSYLFSLKRISIFEWWKGGLNNFGE